MRYEIVLDAGETPNKCTIAPLSYRSDFRLVRVKGEGMLGPLSAPVLLHPDGICLTTLKMAIESLACIDCIWRRLPVLLGRIAWEDGVEPLWVKIPDGFQTAYPRKGYQFKDPDGGLATIEAIFVAAAFAGVWDTTLLQNYYFGRKFVEANASRFVELGISAAANTENWPALLVPSRDSVSRRRGRGQLPPKEL